MNQSQRGQRSQRHQQDFSQGRQEGRQSSQRRDWYDRDPMDERSGYRDEDSGSQRAAVAVKVPINIEALIILSLRMIIQAVQNILAIRVLLNIVKTWIEIIHVKAETAAKQIASAKIAIILAAQMKRTDLADTMETVDAKDKATGLLMALKETPIKDTDLDPTVLKVTTTKVLKSLMAVAKVLIVVKKVPTEIRTMAIKATAAKVPRDLMGQARVLTDLKKLALQVAVLATSNALMNESKKK